MTDHHDCSSIGNHSIVLLRGADGKSTIPCPTMAFGTGTEWFVGANGNDKVDLNRALIDAIKAALLAGFRHIDTAEIYGTEKECGVAIAEFLAESRLPRSSLFITTKVYPSINNIPQALTRSLERLGPAVEGYVDLYLIHAPFFYEKPDAASKPSLLEAWKLMEDECISCRAKSIGVSNFRIKDLSTIIDSGCRIIPAINQIEFHIGCQSPGLIAYMKENSIIPACYGLLTPITPAGEKMPGDAAVAVKAVIEKIVNSKARSAATSVQVLQAWALSLGFVIVTTSNKVERMREYLESVRMLTECGLTEEEIYEISASAEHCDGRGQLRRFWLKESFD